MVKDRHSLDFQEGLYRDSSANPNIYHLTTRDGMWLARSSSGQIYEVDLPQGLPDSSIMPEGKVDASELERMSQEQVFSVIKTISKRISRDSATLALLAGANNI